MLREMQQTEVGRLKEILFHDFFFLRLYRQKSDLIMEIHVNEK